MTSGSEHVRAADMPRTPGSLRRTDGHGTFQRAYRWFSWIFGLAMLVAVIIAALHFSEERAVVRLTEKARPWWLAVAIVGTSEEALKHTLPVIARVEVVPRGR